MMSFFLRIEKMTVTLIKEKSSYTEKMRKRDRTQEDVL